jgi:hypothetical protein
MRVIYEGFENWLNEYGKEMTVAKNSNKTLHSVLARWTSKAKRNLEKIAETEDVDSKDDEEDEGYSSDTGSNLLSKRWSKRDRENQKRSDEHNEDHVGTKERLDKKRMKRGQKGNNSSSRREEYGSPGISDSPRRSNRRMKEW